MPMICRWSKLFTRTVKVSLKYNQVLILGIQVWLQSNKKVNCQICGDYKLTVNGVAKLNTYPLPRIEGLFSSLSAGKYFSELDLTQAYLQLPLDEASRKYITINIQKGLALVFSCNMTNNTIKDLD